MGILRTASASLRSTSQASKAPQVLQVRKVFKAYLACLDLQERKVRLVLRVPQAQPDPQGLTALKVI